VTAPNSSSIGNLNGIIEFLNIFIFFQYGSWYLI